MARYQFRQDNWSYGMSQDELGGGGTVFYTQGVDILKDKSKFTLGSGINATYSNTTSYLDDITSGVVSTNTNQSWFGSTGYVYDFTLAEQFKLSNAGNSNYNPRNSGLVTQDNGAKKGFIIGGTKIHRWEYYYAGLGNGLAEPSGAIDDYNFNNPSSWTVTGGWSITGGTARNTSGTAGYVRQTTTCDATTRYKVKIEVSSTDFTGTLTVSMGGVSIGTITTSGVYYFYRNTAAANEIFEISSPTSTTARIEYAVSYYSTLTEGLLTFAPTGNDNYRRPYYIDGNDIYFGAGSDILVVNAESTGWNMASTKLEIGREQEIVAITKIGDLFYVYANDGSSGYQYLWDGASTAAERVIKWYDLPIRNAANFGNYDMVICSDTVGKCYVYKVSGYSKQLIRQSGYTSDDVVNGRFQTNSSYTNAIETINNILIVPANSSEGGSGGLYAYGNFNPSYPESFSKPFTGMSGYVTATYQSQDGGYNFYVATTSAYTKRLYAYYKPLGTYYHTGVGTVVLNPIVGQFGEAQKKTAVKYRIGYQITNSDGYVKVYYRKDGDTSYTLHQTISGISYASETYPLGVDFQRIQFKFEIYSGSSGYTPTVYDFALEYEPIGNSLGN